MDTMNTSLFRVTWIPWCVAVCLGLSACTTTDDSGGNANMNATADGSSGDMDDAGGDGSDNMSPNDNEDGDDDTDDSAESPDGPTCSEYCDLIQVVCGNEGDFTAQYDSIEACADYCETWAAIPPGTDDDVSGNTIGCRIAQTEAAIEAEDTIQRLELCERAGPSGGDVCGSWCENYCFLSQRNCGGHELHAASEADCLTECEAINDQGRPGSLTGNSIQCRIAHLGAAGNPSDITGDEDPPAPLDMDGNVVTTHREWHCPHGAPVSRDADGADGPCN